MAKKKEKIVDTTKQEKNPKEAIEKEDKNEEKEELNQGKKEESKEVNQEKNKKEEIKKGKNKKKGTKKQEREKEDKKEDGKETQQEEKDIEENAVQVKEELVSIQEIKKTIKKKQNLPKGEMEKINKHLFQNILVALCIIVYFIFLNLGQVNIQGEVYITDLKVFSICILLLAIALIERAYQKDDGNIALYGVEMVVLSLITVALIYVDLMLPTRYAYIVTSISYIFAIYYLIKSIVIYLRKRKKYFVDDMKEVINHNEE